MGSPEVSGLCKGLCIVIKTQPTFIANKGRLTIGSYCNNPTTAAGRMSVDFCLLTDRATLDVVSYKDCHARPPVFASHEL